MAAPWVVSCACGWVAVAETINGVVALVEAHAERRHVVIPYAITIRGTMDPLKRGRQRPISGSAPI
jgi:hypothetical protein